MPLHCRNHKGGPKARKVVECGNQIGKKAHKPQMQKGKAYRKSSIDNGMRVIAKRMKRVSISPETMMYFRATELQTPQSAGSLHPKESTKFTICGTRSASRTRGKGTAESQRPPQSSSLAGGGPQGWSIRLIFLPSKFLGYKCSKGRTSVISNLMRPVASPSAMAR